MIAFSLTNKAHSKTDKEFEDAFQSQRRGSPLNQSSKLECFSESQEKLTLKPILTSEIRFGATDEAHSETYKG